MLRPLSALALLLLAASPVSAQRGFLQRPYYSIRIEDADTTVATVLRTLDATAPAVGLTLLPDSAIGARRSYRGDRGDLRVVVEPRPGRRARLAVVMSEDAGHAHAHWPRWHDTLRARLSTRADSLRLDVVPLPMWTDGSTLCRSPSTPAPDSLFEVTTAPEKVGGPDPAFPQAMTRRRIPARVVLRGLVDVQGRVRCVTALTLSYREANEAALAALRQWRFRPATLDGQPVPVWLTVPFHFRFRTD